MLAGRDLECHRFSRLDASRSLAVNKDAVRPVTIRPEALRRFSVISANCFASY
jgi:hypothetical protein